VSTLVYDEPRNVWRRLERLPLGLSHACAAAVGSSGVLIVGGTTAGDFASNLVYLLDLDDDQGWVSKMPLPSPRFDHDCIAVRTFCTIFLTMTIYICETFSSVMVE